MSDCEHCLSESAQEQVEGIDEFTKLTDRPATERSPLIQGVSEARQHSNADHMSTFFTPMDSDNSDNDEEYSRKQGDTSLSIPNEVLMSIEALTPYEVGEMLHIRGCRGKTSHVHFCKFQISASPYMCAKLNSKSDIKILNLQKDAHRRFSQRLCVRRCIAG